MRVSVIRFVRFVAFLGISAVAASLAPAAAGQGFEHGMEMAAEHGDRGFADTLADRDDNAADDVAAQVGDQDRTADFPAESAFGLALHETADARQTAAHDVAESAVATAPDAGASSTQADQVARRRLLVSDTLFGPSRARDCWEDPPAEPDVGLPSKSQDYRCDPE